MASTDRTSVLACMIVASACGADHALPEGTSTYVDDIAPILQARCVSCHGAPTGVAEARNCVRLDRWESATDTSQVCAERATAGWILGVHDAAAMIVEQSIQGQMPFGGPTLSASAIATLQAWRDAGFPRRSPDAPPTIQFASDPVSVTLCDPACTYAVAYTVADPDGDSVSWSLGWTGGGETGTFSTRLAGGAGMVTIDASSLASGTYGLVAALDDGTVTVSASAPATITIPAGHNAAPTVQVVAPNGGESYYDTQPVLVTWNGGDADGASLAYDVVALYGATKISIATGLTRPVGVASISWTPPPLAAVTAYRIQVIAHDAGSPSRSAADTSDADFVISPPPQQVSFAQQLQPIFRTSCVAAQCHDANQPQQGLNLTAGAAYAALVNVASTQAGCASYKLVLPGQPDQSYLSFKLAGNGACFTGSRMPKAAPALSQSQLQLVRDWIANGAPNN